MASIEERLSALEVVMRDGNITTNGNFYTNDTGRASYNPVKWFMGTMKKGLYFFFQKRFDDQANEKYWAGFETFRDPGLTPDKVSWGYGALPGRMWFQGHCMEADGTYVTRSVVAERVYLAPPVYRHMKTGEFKHPSSWSPSGEPLDENQELMGGIYYKDVSCYITREVDEVVVYNRGIRKVIA